MQSKYNHFLPKFQELGYIENIWTHRYLKFIFYFKIDKYEVGLTERHHILPRSIFKQYSNLKENTWNEAILSNRAHIIAHYMLAKAIGGKMWAPLYFYTKSYKFNSRIIAEIVENNRKLLSDKYKNTVTVYDVENLNYKRVNKIEFETNDNYVGCNKGRKDVGYNISISRKKSYKEGKIDLLIGDKNPMFGMTGDKNPFYGKKHSEKTKLKLRNNRIGKLMSSETKEKIRKSVSKPKENKDGYTKYQYLVLINDVVVFNSKDQRDVIKYLKENNYPSLFRLKSNDILNFKFRKVTKSDF